MDPSIGRLDSTGLLNLVKTRDLDELQALQVLRSPFCTPQIAQLIAENHGILGPHRVRELLAGFPGMNSARALEFIGTLPWGSLLALSQAPKASPMIRRQAERKLLTTVASMTPGEKTALARRAHRVLFRALTETGDSQVLLALLDNPRLVENDILVILNTAAPSAEFFYELARHHRWGQYRRIRKALVESVKTPLPLALSVLVQLTTSELRQLVERRELPLEVREAALSLLEREAKGQRRVIHFSGENGDGGAAQPPEDLR
jgi:hypothetical protein